MAGWARAAAIATAVGCAAPQPRFSHVGGVAGGALWSLGGGEAGLVPTPEVWSLDLDTLAWTRHADAPENVWRATATWDGAAFLVFGGDTGEKLSGSFWRFDPADASWTALPTGPPARYKHAAFWMGDALWVHGGMDDAGLRDDLWRWDGAAWTEAAPGPEPIYRQSATVTDAGEAVIFAGIGEDDRHAKLWTFDGEAFTEVATPDGPVARASHCAWPRDGGVAVALGDGEDTALWQWDGAAWAVLAEAGPYPRDAAVCAQDGDDLYVYGGDLFVDGLPDFGRDVWRFRDGAWEELVAP